MISMTVENITYPIPVDEEKRLEELLSYNILDTTPEKKFDDLVKLASQLCETPISLISLIDANRQWFKAKQGLEVNETSRELAFCAHAIMGDKPFIIQDATKDDRFANNELVTGTPNIRFYAGIPLKSPNGFNLGTLCVIDQKPRSLDDKQLFALQTLANQVISQMELATKAQELQEAFSSARKQKIELEKTIRELHRTQNQLIESEKMAGLSQFTAGIAHEINNPVNFISAGAQALQEIIQALIQILVKYEELKDCDSQARKEILNEISKIKMGLETSELIDDANDMMSDIQNGVKRTNEILTSLLEFANNDNENNELLNINTGIRAGLMLYKNDFLEKRITVETNFDENIPPIEGYKYLLNRVFMNLMNNAIDAVEKDGKITISTESHTHEVKFIIEDDGCGIPQQALPKIFDPFFTTKSIGKGAGLGLAVCYGIITKHNGSILIESTEGEGTKVIISLPK